MSFAVDNDWHPEGWHILSGESPRGAKPDELHSVVAYGKRIVHDPHPSRAGLRTRIDVMLLVPFDPVHVLGGEPVDFSPR